MTLSKVVGDLQLGDNLVDPFLHLKRMRISSYICALFAVGTPRPKTSAMPCFGFEWLAMQRSKGRNVAIQRSKGLCCSGCTFGMPKKNSQLGGSLKHFLFTPRKLEKITILTNIFQMG